MTIEEYLGKDNEIGINIWQNKYRYENETFDEWIDRVSGGVEYLKNLILQKKFLFAGRILSNRGTGKDGRKTTYSNCYVVTPPEDNIESIFDCAKNLARTYSYGGGCGVDISKLAPKGATIRNAAKETTGAISFMELYSTVTGLIGQAGRRGALMISLDCNHPDLEEFIDIKSDINKITKANISIRVDNAFMEAVKNKSNHTLKFIREATGEVIEKEVNAYEVFKKMAYVNWDYGEPGILFWDRIKEHNLLSKTEAFKFVGTNPCGEMPLPAGGSCLLGSINLEAFVNNKQFDFQGLYETAYLSTFALNEVLEEGTPLHPLKEQRDSVSAWKQIGLGIMGLSDALIKMEIKYGSKDSLLLCENIAKLILHGSMEASMNLAETYGPYPECRPEDIISTKFFNDNIIKNNPMVTNVDYEYGVEKFGIRNSQLLTIAPTGSISSMLGVSGGIEPIFANYYTRRTESLHKEGDFEYKIYHKLVKKYKDENDIADDKDLPEYFVTSQDINYKDRINLQSVWQQYIDASISSTVNVPENFSVEDVIDLYIYAYEKGLKGITIFRQNCKRLGVLTVGDSDKKETTAIYDSITPISRKSIGVTHGDTHCKKSACGTLYITVNKDEDGNVVESFVHTTKGGICQANISAVNRLSSLCMRSGVKVDEIVDQLRGIDCKACTSQKSKGNQIDGLSCPDIISRTIQDFYSNLKPEKPIIQKVRTKIETVDNDNFCPECKERIVRDGGCVSCLNCGWTKCD